MDFQEVARPPHFRGHRAKMRIMPPRSAIQVHTQDVSPQDPTVFQMDLGSLGLSYREYMMEQTFECWFAFLCDFQAVPYCHTLRAYYDWKMNSKQALSSTVWLSALRMLEKLSSFMEGKASRGHVFSVLSLGGAVELLRCETSRFAQRT